MTVSIEIKEPSRGCCPVMRHMRVEESSLNIFTGEVGPTTRVYWEDAPCNSPMFTNDREQGCCRSCRRGFESETNTIIDPRFQYLRKLPA